jgi:hypothetical protein
MTCAGELSKSFASDKMIGSTIRKREDYVIGSDDRAGG